jgi:hypothetical protein
MQQDGQPTNPQDSVECLVELLLEPDNRQVRQNALRLVAGAPPPARRTLGW